MTAALRDWLYCLALLSLSVKAQTGPSLHPAEPSAVVPPVNYTSIFDNYQSYRGKKVGPWQQVLDEVAAVPSASGDAGHGGEDTFNGAPSITSAALPDMPAVVKPDSAEHSTSQAGTSSSRSSDTKGIVKAINRPAGKLTLKHGPIPKFDMPGMTMVFRIDDPKLFEEIKEGDEIGVVVERTGGALVITDIQK